MKAMIMAAGYGSRMGTLTDKTPKPLLTVGQYCLIEHLLFQLANAGIDHVVINVCHLANQFISRLGEGKRYGLSIRYSHESEPLRWGGGIIQALPQLGDAPFLVVSGDLYTDYPFAALCQHPSLAPAHLVLTTEKRGHADFHLTPAGHVTSTLKQYTYAGIGRFDPALFRGYAQGRHSFLDIITPVMERDKVSGELFCGKWVNVNMLLALTSLRDEINHDKTKKGVESCNTGLKALS